MAQIDQPGRTKYSRKILAILAFIVILAVVWFGLAQFILVFLSNSYRATIGAVITLIVGLIGVTLLGRVLRGISSPLGDRKAGLIQRAVTIPLYIAVILATSVPLGIDLGSLLTGSAIAGLVIAFALQTFFTNLVSGLIVLFGQSFKAGDPVQLSGIKGNVTQVSFLSTRVMMDDGTIVTIPNTLVLNNPIYNYADKKTAAITFSIALPPEVNAERAHSLIRAFAESRSTEGKPTVDLVGAGRKSIRFAVTLIPKEDSAALIASLREVLLKEGIETLAIFLKE